METTNIVQTAKVLFEARKNGHPIEQLSKTMKLSRADAYAIQEEQMRLREELDETALGWKMGLTSEAKRRQMNLDSPLYGFLTDRMQVMNGGVFRMQGSIHPKIEPEIAFLTKKDLGGKVTRQQVLDACLGIAACMEILDSRYDQFKYFSMEDVIADNSSSSHFVVGPWRHDFASVDLKTLKMEMKVDGDIVQTGVSGDISGDPVVSIIQLCELLATRGKTLEAGSIVLAGAATAAVDLKAGMQVGLSVTGFQPVTVSIA